jgi:hypothetical protein
MLRLYELKKLSFCKCAEVVIGTKSVMNGRAKAVMS